METRRVPILSLVLVTACGGGGSPGAPATRVSPVVDTMHGVAIEDPYRWLEDQTSDEVRDWIAAQERYADSVLGPDTPMRDSLRARLTELMDVPAIGAPRKAGTWEYFTLRRTGEAVGAIYRRPARGAPQKIDPALPYEKVIDPLQLRDDGTTSVGIEGISSDGKLLAWSIRDGGPDEIRVKFRNLSTGADLADSLPVGLYASLSLAGNGSGVYFVHRSRTEGPRYRFHTFGSPAADDSLLFGVGYGPTAFLNVSMGAGGRYRLFTVGHGWARNEVHLQDTRSGAITEITKGLDAHFAPQFVDGQLWMRTDYQAPRGRVVRVDPATPAVEQWKTLIEERDVMLDSFSRIGKFVFVIWIKDVSHRITVHDDSARELRTLDVPPYMSASIRGDGPQSAILSLTSFHRPQTQWKVNLTDWSRTLHEASEVPFDTSAVEVQQLWFTSQDGTRAPLYLMQRKGAARSANTPVLLTGYGGFNVAQMPRFDTRGAAWVERGGIFASATLRGGSEYGEAWHKGGMLTNKQRVFDDFIAAGQFLVDSGYTSPQHLTIRGGSNGGLLMGAALTQRPDLYRAAFVGVPDLDMVRFYTFTKQNNMPALLEYGDASRKEEFDAIVQYSPYQAVKPRTKYPAIMVQTGLKDTRVPPWQARKFTARLQASTGSAEPVILYHDLRSGHAGGRSMAGTIDLATRELDFLWSRAVPPR